MAEVTPTDMHPTAVFFHLVFKISAILVFLFFELFFNDQLYFVCFFIILLLLAADFWTVKNVSGRFLVGLRWWNEIDENGDEHWIFESHEDTRQVHSSESLTFWVSQALVTAYWAICIPFYLKYIPVTVTGMILEGTNLLGFIKCARKARKEVTQWAAGQAMNQAMNQADS